MTAHRNADDGDHGLVLADTLVAIGVLAVVLTLSARATQDSLRRTGRSEASQMAQLEARSRLAAVGSDIPLAPGSVSGQDGALAWNVAVTEAPSPGPPLLRVDVAVTDGDGRRLAELSSLRAAP